LSEVLGIKTITGEVLGIAEHCARCTGNYQKKWAKHWGLKTEKARILAIGLRVGEGLMKTLSRKKKSDLKLEM
jgi:hypothetical protein